MAVMKQQTTETEDLTQSLTGVLNHDYDLKKAREAWNFAVGLIQTDGLEPESDFLQLVERNIQGEISDEDVLAWIQKTYTAHPEGGVCRES